MQVILFLFGAVLGSFLNVIAVRYNPDKFLLARRTWSGRSHCPSCHATLRWFELIPFVSYVIQKARCRRCGVHLSSQYFIAELLAGLIVAFVPGRLMRDFFLPGISLTEILIVQIIFVVAFLTLLLISLIDARLEIIPDELTLFLFALGGAYLWFGRLGFGLGAESFVGHYAILLGGRDTMFVNHMWGGAAGGLFLGLLFALTWGRGMGFGDVKLAVALGFLFGWPDVVFLILAAFITGSIVGLFAIARQRLRLKSFLPFGPFLALGSVILYFWGFSVADWYFTAFF